MPAAFTSTTTLVLRRTAAILGVACVLAATSPSFAQTPAPKVSSEAAYLSPPPGVVAILDVPPSPTATLSPARDVVAVADRVSMPPIAELAQPMLRLAGVRVNPATNGPHRVPGITGITFVSVDGARSRALSVPGATSLVPLGFSPDGKRYAVGAVTPRAIGLWIADVATAQAKPVPGLALNAALAMRPCDWTDDSKALVCLSVPRNRGGAPVAARVPTGPNVQETSGKAAPVATYQDLLTSAHDEALFEYYGGSQVVLVDPATSKSTPVGAPGLFMSVVPSPNGEFLLAQRVIRPFSRQVTFSDFPRDVEVWSRSGTKVRTLATLPPGETVPINGVITGPRDHEWRSDSGATVVWAEALDRGDPKNTVPHRDTVQALAAPFSADAVEIARTEWRFRGIAFTQKGAGLLSESDRPSRRSRTWLLQASTPPVKVFEWKTQDRYNAPGTPMRQPGSDTVQQVGASIFLTGPGASPEGERPFLDRLDLSTLKTERLFHCDTSSYETVVGVLDDDAARLVTRRETKTDPPNVFVRTRSGGALVALTSRTDPAPQLSAATRQLITYERPDGVKLSATLYLPAGYAPGIRLPMIMWAYPREFADADSASQVSGSPNRFPAITGPSHLLFLTQGYAVLDDPAMPIVGPGETANDTYVEQLVASAKAAVDKVVEMGVADRDRIGVGGHSYGAFMTANLLAHSDLFRAGIARSGAYNRTLTPFGFQSETRTFWEVPEIYGKMSPFFHANTIDEPILLIHGEADNNSGTFPIQSERLYMALKGMGGTVRYVTLPYEAHGYAARESVLHTVAEMLNWADAYVKHAKPRDGAPGTARK